MINRITWKQSAIFVLFSLIYIAAGKFGLSLAEINPSISTVWAPTGIALAALLYFGIEFWPAVLIGAFIVNVTTTGDITSSAIIAIGNAAEALLATFLINKFAGGRFFYDRAVNVKMFVFFSVIATAVSATVGILALSTSDFDSWTQTSQAWFGWWLGDLGAAIILTPSLLLIADTKLKIYRGVQALERLLFIISLVTVCYLVYGNVLENHPMGFLLIPLLVWAGLRFTQREAANSTLLIAVIAIIATYQGFGPFVKTYPVDTHVMLLGYLIVIAITTLFLASTVAERNRSKIKLSQAYEHALEGWSKALDLRDKETEGHTLRVAELTVKLAEKVGVSRREQAYIRRGALLHDIGKMAIPDNVLYKPGPLSEEEWIIMRKHPLYATQFLEGFEYSDTIKDIPYCHHEKFDGTGYPRGLKGKDIPICARIFAIADVWDAMRSDRPYRSSLNDKEAIEHMLSLSGTHFDPDILKVFLEMIGTEMLEPQRQSIKSRFWLRVGLGG
ncbi:MAG: hypothetical protein A3I07_01665 [Candidatus Doudnabacteria bacterium RIFCSPLOWO2_02_FULL_42_9]|uniref:HD-GYP domain-containing protein n=1 Tax=Candidatus Doudnabacteria bacterium RIFCSPHIGHO2_01_FULL_41_86 TaxID=1817821 RepID=A0A1F5N7Q3_9BACT|nr:MAG: hypothetical protein A2717_03530 [Candidatus Doudnabacteria bacterium RIFCSPHIGHO2_01_FULL_41_86]OGE74747.1 MAG: hypothetical protein A3K07_03130 [Candidatus Doudnabacteria bacterium RIFCSPHIGHO2_01_43_10]OGE85713.1 MAG: hypothetical protein A3E28_02860 [Candidatus Doudnabacteria bacterium RIFCSPHIGHO2_12_FULL_42_22]OGE87209.1 MAG: hypothetical protein A3C49_00490 [Candidatus Doudnabacteria bacterium RIFCSPHIGHO2_02_FULL_42_25]OGE92046.1 MAG: hypothetical protein A2895_00365 [Candidatus